MGLIIRSFSKYEPFLFFHMIKRKLNGEWEKPNNKEGKIIKFTLDELIFVLQVLSHKKNSWNTEHDYNNKKTEILFNWEDNSDNRLWIFIDKYSKVLNSAEIELFKRLLNHIIDEKIEFSGSSNKLSQREILEQKADINHDILVKLKAMIKKSTKKALLLIFNDSNEAWIPKSSIQNDFNLQFKGKQLFLIDHWILQKKGIIS